jgi:hypothetical protein
MMPGPEGPVVGGGGVGAGGMPSSDVADVGV